MRTRRRGRLLAEAYADPTRKPYDPIVLPGEKPKENLSQPSSRVGSQLPVRKTTSLDEMDSVPPVVTAGPLDSYNSHSALVGAGATPGYDYTRQSRQTSAAYSGVGSMNTSNTPGNRFSFEPQVEQPPPAMVYDRSRDSGSSHGGYASPYGPPSPYGPRSYTPVHTPPPQAQSQMAPGGSWGAFPASASPPSRVLPQGMGDGRLSESVRMQQLPPQTGYAM